MGEFRKNKEARLQAVKRHRICNNIRINVKKFFDETSEMGMALMNVVNKYCKAE